MVLSERERGDDLRVFDGSVHRRRRRDPSKARLKTEQVISIDIHSTRGGIQQLGTKKKRDPHIFPTSSPCPPPFPPHLLCSSPPSRQSPVGSG